MPQSVVSSGGNPNSSSKLLSMTSLPTRMKRIQSKILTPIWPRNLSHYKAIGIYPDAQGQPTSIVGSGQISFMVVLVLYQP